MGSEAMAWDKDALQRLEKIPAFVRGKARAKIEKVVRESGESRVTAAFMDANKEKLKR